MYRVDRRQNKSTCLLKKKKKKKKKALVVCWSFLVHIEFCSHILVDQHATWLFVGSDFWVISSIADWHDLS